MERKHHVCGDYQETDLVHYEYARQSVGDSLHQFSMWRWNWLMFTTFAEDKGAAMGMPGMSRCL